MILCHEEIVQLSDHTELNNNSTSYLVAPAYFLHLSIHGYKYAQVEKMIERLGVAAT